LKFYTICRFNVYFPGWGRFRQGLELAPHALGAEDRLDPDADGHAVGDQRG
jgi:hypothetical protein